MIEKDHVFLLSDKTGSRILRVHYFVKNCFGPYHFFSFSSFRVHESESEGVITMETNLIQQLKPQQPVLQLPAAMQQQPAFLGHVHKPEGGCQGCKGCGACGKKADQGKALDLRV